METQHTISEEQKKLMDELKERYSGMPIYTISKLAHVSYNDAIEYFSIYPNTDARA